MAKKVTKSPFMSRLAEAHELHKGDETRIGSGGDLPAGIEHGVARLSDAKIGVYQKGDNEGEPYFMAAGIVLEPETVLVVDPKTKKSRAIHIRGLRTQIGPEPLCDTKAQNGNETSLADHWDRVLNHLRLLGIDTKDLDPTDVVVEHNGTYDSGPVLEALVQAAPTFRFRTWQGKATQQYPNPRINHEWRGACEYDEGTSEDVQDDTAKEAEWESDEADEAEEVEQEEAAVEAEVDFLALGELADAGKPKKEATEAARTLAGHAKILNIDSDSLGTWTEVAEAIVAHEEPEAEDANDEAEADEEYEEEVEDWIPTAGEIVFFAGPGKKPIEAEVVKVFAKQEKADLKRLDTKKLVKGVPFAKINADGSPF